MEAIASLICLSSIAKDLPPEMMEPPFLCGIQKLVKKASRLQHHPDNTLPSWLLPCSCYMPKCVYLAHLHPYIRSIECKFFYWTNLSLQPITPSPFKLSISHTMITYFLQVSLSVITHIMMSCSYATLGGLAGWTIGLPGVAQLLVPCLQQLGWNTFSLSLSWPTSMVSYMCHTLTFH